MTDQPTLACNRAHCDRGVLAFAEVRNAAGELLRTVPYTPAHLTLEDAADAVEGEEFCTASVSRCEICDPPPEEQEQPKTVARKRDDEPVKRSLPYREDD